jgi:hypothetical protein
MAGSVLYELAHFLEDAPRFGALARRLQQQAIAAPRLLARIVDGERAVLLERGGRLGLALEALRVEQVAFG